MSETVLLLYAEHRNLSQLLDLLDEQARSLEQGAEPDFRLLRGIAEYLTDYPDECHHPIEDLIYRKLLQKQGSPVRDSGYLLKEHRELNDLTRQFVRITQAATAEANHGHLPRDIRRLVQAYRQHMLMEEEHFFPEVLRLLSRIDWAEIDHTVFDRSDPLFDRKVEDRYRELWQRLTEYAGEIRCRNREWLATVNEISDFNKTEKYSDLGIRLVRTESGHYALMRNGKRLVRFPKCSEIMAIWCAYYYLEGKYNADFMPDYPKPNGVNGL